jgi:hypothetical protein
MKLLTLGNTKTVKGEALGYQTYIMHLAPARMSGYQVCPMASAGCASACLNTAGRGRFTRTQEARVRKTKWFFEDRASFLANLVKDIEAAIRKSKRENFIPVFRLNGTSDIRWETVPVMHHQNIMAMFPQVQFYDYTKLANRTLLPKNYHLTFSRSEVNAQELVTTPLNIAVVFNTLPATYMGREVIDGTETDLRFMDAPNVVVGLLAKGKGKQDRSGFVVQTAA